MKRFNINVAGLFWLLGVIALVAAIVCAGCQRATYQNCYDKYGTIAPDTVEVEVLVMVPPDSAMLALALDSLMRVQLRPGDTLTAFAEDSTIILKQYIEVLHDSLGGLHRQLKTKARYTGKVITKVAECPPCAQWTEPAPKPPKADRRSWARRQFDKVSLEICGLLLLLCVVLFILHVTRR